MTKEIIIIAVIICLIYYYYQQNQPHILEDSPETKNLIKDLKGQVQHYQNLYQKRVAHDLNKNSVEIQTDNFIGESKETQTPLTLKYSRDTQTDLKGNQISLLTQQWNQVASWAKELGIDINKTWNLGIVKEKLKERLEEKQKDNNLKTQEINQLSLEKQANLAQIKEKNKELSGKQKTIQGLTLLADKRKIDSNILSERLKKELEQEKQALIDLAKQKVANKKQAAELLAQLEAKWQLEKAQLTKNLDNMNQKEELIKELQKKIEELEGKIRKLEEFEEKEPKIGISRNGFLFLENHDGELDIGEVEENWGKTKEVWLKENVKNLSIVNHSLPLLVRVGMAYEKREPLGEIFNLNWLHDNKEAALAPSYYLREFVESEIEWENDKFYRKIVWNLISKRGRKILNADGIELLIDISDLDQITDDYDYSRFAGMEAGKKEDIKYHTEVFGGDGWFRNLYTAFDNLANKILARNLIVLSRLLTSKEDLEAGKLKLYEENINKLANDYQKCGSMLPGKPWTSEETQAIIDQALTPDYELLQKLADLPYISPWVKEKLAEAERERERERESKKRSRANFQQKEEKVLSKSDLEKAIEDLRNWEKEEELKGQDKK